MAEEEFNLSLRINKSVEGDWIWADNIKEFIKRDEELIVRLQNKEITFDEFLDLRKEIIGEKLI